MVVDDKEAAQAALRDEAIETEPGQFLNFRDPRGNLVEIVGYENIQFTKANHVLRGMGLSNLRKNDTAILTDKGMVPEPQANI